MKYKCRYSTLPHLRGGGTHNADRLPLRRHREIGGLGVVATVRYRVGGIHVSTAADGAQRAVARVLHEQV